MSKAPIVTRRRFMMATGSAIAALGVQSAWGQGRIKIDPDNFQPMPIAIPAFVPGTPADGQAGADVTGVITNNLKRSGLFAPIDPSAFIDRITNSDDPPRFANWKQINAQALVVGRVTRQGDGGLKAEFRLWDVGTGQQLDGQSYVTSPEYWRRISHIISDRIYERLTGHAPARIRVHAFLL